MLQKKEEKKKPVKPKIGKQEFKLKDTCSRETILAKFELKTRTKGEKIENAYNYYLIC